MLGNFGCVVVAATLRGAVAHIMLGASCDAVMRIEPRTLIAPYVRRSHGSTQERIFARTFRHAAPTSIACDVNHRRECPADTARRRFDRRHPRSFLHQRGIPRRSQSQRNRELGLKSVNDVEPEEERYMQSGLFYRDPLILIDLARIDDIEQRPDLPPGNHIFIVSPPRPGPCSLASGILHELANFLIPRHVAENRFQPRVKTRAGNYAGGVSARCQWGGLRQ